MSHPFEIGKQYRNRNGEYTVLKLDDDTMIFRYADGRTMKSSIAQQARILNNLQEEAEYGEERE